MLGRPEWIEAFRKEEITKVPNLLSLADQTITRLRGYFDAKGQRPSDEMWTALTDLASKLEAMANGTCEPKFFLSSLDPGVGKTQTVTHFLKSLTSSLDHLDVGVLICVSRLDEIDRFVEEMELSRIEYAVLTSDEKRNKLGIGSALSNKARVLFTTQQMVERRGAGRDFDDMRELQFFGRPRQVRIWDESILPGQTVTLNKDDMGLLPRALRLTHHTLAEAIDTFSVELRSVADGATYQVPDFPALAAKKVGKTCNKEEITKVPNLLGLNEALGLVAGAEPQEPLKQAMTALWSLSGKTVSVRRDWRYGNTMLDYKDTLPEGLAPLVILDASGRVREIYRQWQESRDGLELLTVAKKRYDNLTVHCWQTSGGKNAFRKNGQSLLDGIAETINSKPEEDWLVVHIKDGIGFDFVPELQKRITGNPERVHCIHWGNHHATNDYVEIPNVILAGTLFYRPSQYEALARLAAAKHPAQGAVPSDTIDAVTLGEHRHMILQALCRGRVRRCDGDVCLPCDAYIIAAARSGIPEALPEIFPGCRVVRWQPVQKDLRGKVKEAVEFIVDWFEKTPDDLLRFNVVQKALGISAAGTFKNDVRDHPDFIEALDNHGIAEAWRIGDNRRGFLKPCFALFP
jgi:hypothetical protein